MSEMNWPADVWTRTTYYEEETFTHPVSGVFVVLVMKAEEESFLTFRIPQMHVIFISQLKPDEAEELIKKKGLMPMMSFLSKEINCHISFMVKVVEIYSFKM